MSPQKIQWHFGCTARCRCLTCSSVPLPSDWPFFFLFVCLLPGFDFYLRNQEIKWVFPVLKNGTNTIKENTRTHTPKWTKQNKNKNPQPPKELGPGLSLLLVSFEWILEFFIFDFYLHFFMYVQTQFHFFCHIRIHPFESVNCKFLHGMLRVTCVSVGKRDVSLLQIRRVEVYKRGDIILNVMFKHFKAGSTADAAAAADNASQPVPFSWNNPVKAQALPSSLWELFHRNACNYAQILCYSTVLFQVPCTFQSIYFSKDVLLLLHYILC